MTWPIFMTVLANCTYAASPTLAELLLIVETLNNLLLQTCSSCILTWGTGTLCLCHASPHGYKASEMGLCWQAVQWEKQNRTGRYINIIGQFSGLTLWRLYCKCAELLLPGQLQSTGDKIPQQPFHDVVMTWVNLGWSAILVQCERGQTKIKSKSVKCKGALADALMSGVPRLTSAGIWLHIRPWLIDFNCDITKYNKWSSSFQNSSSRIAIKMTPGWK